MAANVEAMVREGVNAFKAGQKEEAHALLLKATELDPYNEQAWLWLSGLMETPDDQRTCLENVLAINPNNERARQGLSYLGGQTSAGNQSPFAANSSLPPSAPSPSAPTSVEWAAPSDPPAAWNRPAPQEPTPAVLDDWVSNLRLQQSGDAGTTNSADVKNASASPFGGFNFDDDSFEGGPFSTPPLDLDEEPDTPPSRASTATPPARSAPPERSRRVRPTPPREEKSIRFDTDQENTSGESEMFGYIPAEIQPTRLPGTQERTPVLLTLGVILLILVNLAVAVVVMLSLLT